METMSLLASSPWTPFEGVQTITIEKHDRPLVHWTIAFPSGNYADPAQKRGLVNLMGEMLLRGTKKHSREEIEQKLDFLGANLEISVGSQSMMIDGEVLVKNLPALLDLVAEILTEPAFPELELNKLKEELTSQMHLALESDAHLARGEFSRRLFGDHPYGHDEEGTPESLKRINLDDVKTIYGSLIRKNGILVGTAGALGRKDFETFFKPLIQKIPAGGEGSISKPMTATNPKGLNIVLVDKPERSQAHFFIGQPGINLNNPDYIPLNVFMTAFAGGLFQAQYMQEIRVKRGWAYGAYGKVDSRRDGGSFYLYTYPKISDTPEAIAVSLSLLENAVNGSSVNDTSIEFAKNYILRSYPFTVDLPEKVLAEAFYNKIVGRPDNYSELYLKMIKETTPQNARAAAQKNIDTKNLWIVVLCTAKDLKGKLQEKLHPNSIDVVPFDKFE